MKIAICGAGIAGLTLAWWLARAGHRVLVIERSPALRTEGYMLDFFGSGWDVAERMGLLDQLAAIHYPIPELLFVDESGATQTAISYVRMRRLFAGRHFNFMRGDLERVLFEALPEHVEVRFDTRLETVEDQPEGVRVGLSDGSVDEFDLLVGADGVHSQTRALALGSGEQALRDLGYRTAAYVITDASLCARFDGAFRTMTVPGRQVGIYPIRGGKLATFFIHDARHQPAGMTGPGAILRAVYGELGWVVPELLALVPDDREVYFDVVAQVELAQWTRGHVTLVGDACQAVSLLAGQGASMAMGGAWALARELDREGSVSEACARYHAKVGPAITRKQAAGRNMARWFVPSSRARIRVRNLMLEISSMRGMSWLLARTLSRESIVDD